VTYEEFSIMTNALYRQAVTDNIAAVFALKSMCCLINMLHVTIEGIVHCTGIHGVLENWHEGSLTHYWPWHLMEVSGKDHTPVALPQGKNPVPIETSMHRSQNPSGWRKSLALARI
jgi:hypothetical protein